MENQLQIERSVASQATQIAEKMLAEFGPFVSLSEAANKTGVSLKILTNAVAQNRIPVFKLLGRVWVRVSAVQAYLETTSPPDALSAILEMSKSPALQDAMPADFALQHDHYLYGTDKTE